MSLFRMAVHYQEMHRELESARMAIRVLRLERDTATALLNDRTTLIRQAWSDDPRAVAAAREWLSQIAKDQEVA